MLQSLHVKNIALIDDVEISFGKGLNILTGETGAGKSILIDAVNFALGARMPKDIVRDDAQYALCELVFYEDQQEVLDVLRNKDILVDDGQVILQRKIVSGKSSIKINGETFTTAVVKDIAAELINIHGQHEHQSLTHPAYHRQVLDGFCGSQHNDLLCKLSDVYKNYTEIKEKLSEALKNQGQSHRELDYAKFVVEEIEAAKLVVGEDDELESRFRLMENGRKIVEAVSAARSCICGESGASDAVSRAIYAMKGCISFDEKLADYYNQLSDVDNLLSDCEREMEDYIGSLEFSDEDYRFVSERLDLINKLKSKYGDTIEKVRKHAQSVYEQIRMLEDYEGYLDGLRKQETDAFLQVMEISDQISKKRVEMAETLSEELQNALIDLNFLHADFRIEVIPNREKISSFGYDDIRFMISTNPGESRKPLDEVSSGGELSRIMLALKSVLARKDNIGTLIFDEIDTGISGITAACVAEKMQSIASQHQVICVTHLPQIAACADTHFEISKSATNGRTITNVRALNEEESIGELTRMLGGTDAARENATDLRMRVRRHN